MIFNNLLIKKEFILSKQFLRAATSIGANVREAQQAQSRKDFVSKVSIALKEAHESLYWLELLYATGYLTKKEFDYHYSICLELNKILNNIVKTTKLNDK